MPCSETGISWSPHPHNRVSVLQSCCHQLVDSAGLLAAAIPDRGLDVDVGVPLQLMAENLAYRCHTIGSTHQVDVVQESEYVLEI